MQVYLPIAEMSVDAFAIVALGGLVGFTSGLFGVGGGFLMTPLLIFLGIPPSVAVGSGTNQIIASSISGVIAHWRRGNVDVRMGTVLLSGGVVGSGLGVLVFNLLKAWGQIDLTIRLSYVVFLASVGGLMLVESVISLVKARGVSASAAAKPRGAENFAWATRLPLLMRFPKSGLYISALLPLAMGVLVGILVAIMGVGGGFIMVPAMIYLLGMPTQVVIGTSLFQIIFVTMSTTFMQATLNHNVDAVLTILLMVGGVLGAQWGARVGAKLGGRHLRILLALMVLVVCFGLVDELVTTPSEAFSMTMLR
ncbi:MAG: sulfite exporter TauE/SafE family protein [Rhodospirillaceae bacterium]|nr:sulfite exporter TauE/SafE family protein [Rhodospirillaceae bacterium]